MFAYTNVPDNLYHYTNVESVKHIIEDRTILLSELTTMNDPLEGTTTLTHKDKLPHFYVSCWSELEAESIPHWSMYGNNFTGVRIKLPTITSLEDCLSDRKHSPIYAGDIYKDYPTLIRVIYTDDQSLISGADIGDDIVKADGEVKTIVTHEENLGVYKSCGWKYESEWRYRVITSNKYEEGILINIPDEVYEKMEITMGLKIISEDREKLQNICKESGITITSSNLNIRFKE